MHRPTVGRYIGRLSVDYRSTIGRLSVDYRPIVGRLSTDSRPINVHISGDALVDHRSIYRSTIGRLSVDYRSTIGRLSVDCRPICRPRPPIVHMIQKIKACKGFEPKTYVIPVQSSTN